MAPKRIGFFVYPGFAALDLFGPYEAFAAAVMPDGIPAYEPIIFSANLNPIESESGAFVQPRETTATLGPVDTILIPGGKDFGFLPFRTMFRPGSPITLRVFGESLLFAPGATA